MPRRFSASTRNTARLKPGKVADLVLYDGDPFEHSTHVTHTIMSGGVVHDRAEYLKLPFERRAMPLSANGGDYGCCLGIVVVNWRAQLRKEPVKACRYRLLTEHGSPLTL